MHISVDVYNKEYENEIADLVRVFFPKYVLTLETKKDSSNNYGDKPDYIHDSNVQDLHLKCGFIKKTENEGLCFAVLMINRRIATRKEKALFVQKGSNLAIRKYIKNALKRCTYETLASFTGYKPEWGILTGIRPTKIVHKLLDEGMDIEQIMSVLNKQYCVSQDKAMLLLDITNKQRPILIKNNKQVISIYIHIPFCESKCLYCSFPSYIIDSCQAILDDYIECLIMELTIIINLLRKKGIIIQTLYIGGGTPTALSSVQLERLLSAIDDLLENNPLDEYTVEGGRPDSFNTEKMMLLKMHRVNRISINPQTMNEDTLANIGRNHSVEQIISCYYAARKIGFDSINMDVIIGLPGEDTNSINYTMKQIAQLEPDNVTVHTLAIKRASRLKSSLEQYHLADSKNVEEMFDSCRKWIEAMGLQPYYLYRQKYMIGNLENVGYAKPGKQCIYNIQMMEEKQSIVAFGAGAVSKFYYAPEDRIERLANVKNVMEYIKRLQEMIDKKLKIINNG